MDPWNSTSPENIDIFCRREGGRINGSQSSNRTERSTRILKLQGEAASLMGSISMGATHKKCHQVMGGLVGGSRMTLLEMLRQEVRHEMRRWQRLLLSHREQRHLIGGYLLGTESAASYSRYTNWTTNPDERASTHVNISSVPQSLQVMCRTVLLLQLPGVRRSDAHLGTRAVTCPSSWRWEIIEALRRRICVHYHGWHSRHAQELGNVVGCSTKICQTGRMTLGNVLQGILTRNGRWSAAVLRLWWDVGVAPRNGLLIQSAGIKLLRATGQPSGRTEIILRICEQTVLPVATGMNGA
jgi:hypothetical protein